MKNKLFLYIFNSIISLTGNSQNGGTGVFAFLQLPKSSHISALGGTLQSIISNDVSNVFHNPALLNDSMLDYITVSANKYFADIYYGNLGYATKIIKKHKVFIGVNYFNYGKFTRTDEVGNVLGYFYASDYVLNVSYAERITNSNFYYGISFKPLFSVYEHSKSFGTCFDFSILYYNTEDNFSINLALNNLGIQMIPYTKNNYEPVSYNINLSASKRFIHSPFYLHTSIIELQNFNLSDYKDIIKEQDNQDRWANVSPFRKVSKLETLANELIYHIVVGTDMVITKNFYLSVGYNFKRRNELTTDGKKKLTGFSWGFGFKLFKFQIHFSRSRYHVAQAFNMLTINTNLNEIVKVNK